MALPSFMVVLIVVPFAITYNIVVAAAPGRLALPVGRGMPAILMRQLENLQKVIGLASTPGQ